MEEEKTKEEQDRCDFCFRNDHYRYFHCLADCGLNVTDLKKEIAEIKAQKK
ncbi:MAG: hypothetical protein WCI63_01435 [bacterium]